LNLESAKQAEQQLLLQTYDRYPIYFREGKGVTLVDDQGKEYIDFLSGIGVNALGYGHPAITKVIAEQAAKMIHVSNLFYTEFQSTLARKLTQLSGLDRAFFCNSGTEAMECAFKLARLNGSENAKIGGTPRWKVLSMENAFHGRTFGAVSATWTEKYRAPFAPLVPGFDFVKFNDVADLHEKFDDSVAAIVIEVIQGEGGIYFVAPEFLKAARELTAESGAVLIIDEIQSGLGRTGKWFTYQYYDVKPDIVTLAKPLAAGLPLGCVLIAEKTAAAMHPGLHGTTFGGGPLACATALKFLEVIESDGLLAHVNEVGDYFKEKLSALKSAQDCITDVRGRGLMVGLSIDSEEIAKDAHAAMLQRGFLINRTHGTTLRFLPPYIITTAHVDAMVTALGEVLSEVREKHLLHMAGGQHG